MSPYELIRTQKGGRLYFLWKREKNPQKKQKYQEEFNKLLEAEEVRMNNKEAIEILKAYKQKLDNACSNQLDKDSKAFDLAIKALETIENIKFNVYALNEMILIQEVVENDN